MLALSAEEHCAPGDDILSGETNLLFFFVKSHKFENYSVAVTYICGSVTRATTNEVPE